IGIAPAGIYGYDRITKERLPHDAINEVIADLFSFRPPSYAVIEGFRGMEGYGPIWGDELAHNVVLVGGDAAACDAVASAIMGYNPWDIGALHNLADKQLGVNDLRRIYVKGNEVKALRRPFKKSPKEHPYARFNLDGYFGRGNRTWLVHGPHPAAALPQNGLEHDFLGGEAHAQPKLGDPTWERLCSKHNDYIDLKKRFGEKCERAVTYAFCQVRSDARRPCDLLVGNDKPVKVWLNGQIVLFDREPKRFSYLQNRVPIELQAGVNTLLVKAVNTAGDHGFSLALADADGNTPPGIEYFIPSGQSE
ncbi:MAG: DUF362 domain-containing protein, partial [Planctomycetes bacterium]|nr:DUF362 domain-containing protein [Planctomycetota bacterium]